MKKIESMSHAMRTRHKNNIFVSTSQRKRIFFSKNIPSHCAKAPAGSSANFRTVRKLQQVLPQTFALCESSSGFFRKFSHCATTFLFSFSIYFFGLTIITTGLSSSSNVSTSSFSFPLSFPWALASTKRCG